MLFFAAMKTATWAISGLKKEVCIPVFVSRCTDRTKRIKFTGRWGETLKEQFCLDPSDVIPEMTRAELRAGAVPHLDVGKTNRAINTGSYRNVKDVKKICVSHFQLLDLCVVTSRVWTFVSYSKLYKLIITIMSSSLDQLKATGTVWNFGSSDCSIADMCADRCVRFWWLCQ